MVRNPNEREFQYIAASLKRLRDHFSVWSGYENREYHLIFFAIYEGCCKGADGARIIAETSPFALGQELVDYYGFEWVIVQSQNEVSSYAVNHPVLEEPIDIFALEDGRWCEEEFDEAPVPGDSTYYSLDPILKAVNLRWRPDRHY